MSAQDREAASWMLKALVIVAFAAIVSPVIAGVLALVALGAFLILIT